MKITPAHFEELKNLIAPVAHYLPACVERAKADPRTKDVDTRARWDVFWCIGQTARCELMTKLYVYLDDTHIDTALKAALKHAQNHINKQ